MIYKLEDILKELHTNFTPTAYDYLEFFTAGSIQEEKFSVKYNKESDCFFINYDSCLVYLVQDTKTFNEHLFPKNKTLVSFEDITYLFNYYTGNYEDFVFVSLWLEVL